MDFCRLEEIYSNKCKKTFIGCCYKHRTRCSKNCDQKVAHKAAEELIGNHQIADKIVKPKPVPDTNSRYFEEISNPTVSLFVTKKWIKIIYLSGGQYSANKNIRFKAPMLRSDLCDYNDVYLIVKKRTNFTVYCYVTNIIGLLMLTEETKN